MSETKMSIEERAKRICYRLDLAPTWNNGGEEAIELIEDLMAEREKLISRVEELEELYYNPYPED